MLKEVFRTVPIPTTHAGETTMDIKGLHVGRTPASITSKEGDATPESPTSIYAFTFQTYPALFFTWFQGYYRFDGYTGKLIRNVSGLAVSGLGAVLAMLGGTMTSRLGNLYSAGYAGFLYKLTKGPAASMLVGDELEDPQPGDGWTTVLEGEVPGDTITTDAEGWHISRFEAYDTNGNKLGGWGSGGCFAIDEVRDIYLDISYKVLRAFTWSTGKFLYSILLPEFTKAMTFEDDARVYIFTGERSILLFNYVRGEFLGIGTLPKASGIDYGPNQAYYFAVMAYDVIHKRILIMERVEGQSPVIKGYRFVEFGDRITTPIPLRVPRRGRTIPVLVKVVSDRNVGIGGYAISATVGGDGTIVGIPLSDNEGNAFIQVDCGDPASEYDPYDAYAGGSDPSSLDLIDGGSFSITAKARILSPKVGTTGVPGVPPGTPSPVPGPPVAGPPTGPNVPPAQAPNMIGVLNQVYAAGGPSGPWDLSSGNVEGPNGQGVFTEYAVTAMHDQNAGFGHIHKNPGQAQYNGHAHDSCAFKRTDGGFESIDFLAGFEGTITWQYNYYYAASTNIWYYPA